MDHIAVNLALPINHLQAMAVQPSWHKCFGIWVSSSFSFQLAGPPLPLGGIFS